MKNLIIFGSGDLAKIVFYEVIQKKDFKLLGFINESKKENSIVIQYKGQKYNTLNLDKINGEVNGIIAISDNHRRRECYKKTIKKNKKIKWAKIISENSFIGKETSVGKGSIILQNSVINHGSKIGDHCIINTSNSIDHDNIFHDFSSTGPGVITAGGVKVGKLSFLGIGAKVKQYINLGQNVIVGGNSFVNKDCKPNNVYYGNPIKLIRKNSNK